MPTAITTALTAILCVAGATGRQPVLKRFTPGVTWSGAVRDRTGYVFLNSRFSFDVYRRQSDGQIDVRLKMRHGRFGSGFLLQWFRGARLGAPEHVWACNRPDGAAVAHVTFALEHKGEKVGQSSIRAIRPAAYPEWTFFRVRAMPPAGDPKARARVRPGQLAQFYLSVALKWQLHRSPRTLVLDWPGGRRPGGDKPPWADKKPDFNGLALHAKGVDEQTQCEFIVFDPARIARIRLQRWGRYDGVGGLVFVVEPARDHVFAIGSTTGDNAQRVAVPRFMQRQRQEILRTLQSMDWSVGADTAGLARDLAEAACLLKQRPDPKLQKRHDELAAALRSLGKGDTDAAMALADQTHALLEAIAAKTLASLPSGEM